MQNIRRQIVDRYSPQECGIIVTMLFTNYRSEVLIQRELRRRFPSGQLRSRCSVKNIVAVTVNVQEVPQLFTRRRTSELGIRRRSLQPIMVKKIEDVTIQSLNSIAYIPSITGEFLLSPPKL